MGADEKFAEVAEAYDILCNRKFTIICVSHKKKQKSEEYHRTNTSSHCRDEWSIITPRRACAARVTVVVLCVCVCVCVRGPHLRLAQLSDKLDILAVSVSCWLVFKKGVFRIMASFLR